MRLLAWLLVAPAWLTQLHAALPDIREIEPDLVVPPLTASAPAPGKRVRQTHADWRATDVYHVLYLPTNWTPDKRLPVLVEFAGNGPYQNQFGDLSTGQVEGSKLGYGISAGRDFIWLCLPYLDNTGRTNVSQWWGTRPTYDPNPTIDHTQAVIRDVCQRFGGDTNRLVLCGFSRGAIACNFIGLHNDEIARLWCAFIPYSHYDGVRSRWPYPGADRESALARLRRLNGRPQFICGESNNAYQTRDWLKSSGITGNFTFVPTGFRNHNDAWVLRPSPARTQLRDWLRQALFEIATPQP